MTIEIGFWMLPAALTLAAVLHLTFRAPTDQWDIGGGLIAVLWLGVVVTSWGMWGLSWMF